MDVEPTVAATLIQTSVSDMPTLGLVLGTGFSAILDDWEIEHQFPFSDLPGFFKPSVPGHEEAAFLVARQGPARVLIVSGRMHFYEGYSMDSATMAIRVLARCGIQSVLLTNSAGAIREDLRVGDMVFLEDHINFMGVNPLHKWSGSGGEGFLDLGQVYSEELNRILEDCARRSGIRIGRAVYVGVPGPSFETPAEIRMFRILGGDIVGMSILPEAVAAHRFGIRVAGLSYITNLAAGLSGEPLDHSHCQQRLQRNKEKVSRLVSQFCSEVARQA